MIHGEDGGQTLTLRQIHESSIREIHGAIRIARHQRLHLREFPILDRRQHDAPERTNRQAASIS